MLAQKLQHEVEPPTQHYADLDPFWTAVIVTATHRETAARFKDAVELRGILQEGENSAWWLARTEDRAAPSAQPALKRLRLQREVSLVGRAPDLQRVRSSYSRIGEGGRVLLIGGASGVGKSRLVYEFLEEIAAAGGPAIAAGRSVGRGGRSYHPFVEAICDLLGVEGRGEAGQRARLQERLAKYLPSTPGMVEPLANFLLGDVSAAGGAIEKDALLAACADLMRQVARERPVVIGIEDLQLAGPESLDLFAYLARCVSEHPILLVGVYADDDVEEGSDLHEFITQAGTEDGRDLLQVLPLTVSATDELVGAIVVHPPARSRLAWPLHQRSDGNPLVVPELLNHLRETGALEPEGDGYRLVRPLAEDDLPANLQDMVNLKLGRLDEEQREVLEVAAILGYVFEASLLASVLEVKKIKLLQRLAVLERKFRLLRSSGRNSFRFANHQLRDGIYESISPALRIEYHAVVAEAIADDLDGAAPEPVTAYALLRHLYLSEQALQAEPILEPALSYMATNVHAGVAAPFLEKVAQAFGIARPATRIAISRKLWTFHEMLGERAEELRILEEAKVIADEWGDAGARGQVLSCLAATHWLGGDMDKVAEEAPSALELLREAGDRNWTAKTLHTLGGLSYMRGDPQAANTYWEEALTVRREIGDRKGEVSSMLALAAVMPAIGKGEQALPTKKEALAIAREIGERRFEAALLNNIGHTLQHQHLHEEALEQFEGAVAIARELGDQASEATALGNAGAAQWRIGRIEQAKASIERSIVMFREINRPGTELAKRLALAMVLASCGERRQAIDGLKEAIALGERIDDNPQLAAAETQLGAYLHEWGQREEGWQHLERALEMEKQLENDDGQAEALERMGNAALNEQRFAEATQYLEESLSKGGQGDSSNAVLARCRLASAYQGAGDGEKAQVCADTAQQMLDRLVRVSPDKAPEIHYRLAALTDDEEQRVAHLTTAEHLVSLRASAITNGGYREHYLTQTGYNPAILAAAKRLREEA